MPPKVLVVDLNNFARYPTVAVGYLVAEMRRCDFEVELFSPLAVGVAGVVRETPVRPWSLIDERIRYRTAISRNKLVLAARRTLAQRRSPATDRNTSKIIQHLIAKLDNRPDIVLVSAYLMYHGVCAEICREAAARGIPVLIGGAYFSQPSVAQSWLKIPGLTALVGGEAEPMIAHLVESVLSDEDLRGLPGVWTPNEVRPSPAPPLKDLDSLAFPDYSDFPWHLYPNRIVPIITGRGCGWGACSFCSDVTSSMGRTFRSRSAENVLEELEYQAKQHDSSQFMFVDLKLNSDLALWNGLIDGISKRIPQAEWAASVHVGVEEDNGLSPERLKAARAAGLVRLTTGFESGSQKVLDLMKKGTNVETTARFLSDANEADISVRLTMIIGYPEERPVDLHETADFLTRHAHLVERVSLNRLAIIEGTPLHRQIEKKSDKFPDLVDFAPDGTMATLAHRNRRASEAEHLRAVDRVLKAVHLINRQPLRSGARGFDGVM